MHCRVGGLGQVVVAGRLGGDDVWRRCEQRDCSRMWLVFCCWSRVETGELGFTEQNDKRSVVFRAGMACGLAGSAS